jgi:hypothetical protein
LSLSSTDYVGHQFGINSIELGTYLRLDKDIEEFFKMLVDLTVGKVNIQCFLSSDMAAHNPKFFIRPIKFLFNFGMGRTILTT